MKIKVLGTRVLIKPIKKEEKTAGGIYVPDSVNENNKEGIVEEIGSYDIKDKEFPVKKGDHVIYGGYSSNEVTFDDMKYVIVDVKDILAKFD